MASRKLQHTFILGRKTLGRGASKRLHCVFIWGVTSSCLWPLWLFEWAGELTHTSASYWNLERAIVEHAADLRWSLSPRSASLYIVSSCGVVWLIRQVTVSKHGNKCYLQYLLHMSAKHKPITDFKSLKKESNSGTCPPVRDRWWLAARQISSLPLCQEMLVPALTASTFRIWRPRYRAAPSNANRPVMHSGRLLGPF